MCDPILVTLSQSSRENATPSSATSPLAYFKEVPPPPPPGETVTLELPYSIHSQVGRFFRKWSGFNFKKS